MYTHSLQGTEIVSPKFLIIAGKLPTINLFFLSLNLFFSYIIAYLTDLELHCTYAMETNEFHVTFLNTIPKLSAFLTIIK